MMDALSEQVVDLDAAFDQEHESTGQRGGAGRGLDAVDEQLIDRLAARARADGLQLAGEGGLLAQLTKRLLESALEGELTDHLGYDRHDVAGRDGGNSASLDESRTIIKRHARGLLRCFEWWRRGQQACACPRGTAECLLLPVVNFKAAGQ